MCIELLHLPYHDIMMMPVKRFYDLIEWKIKIDKEAIKQTENLRNLKVR